MTLTNSDVIFDNIDTGIILLDEDLNVIYWNRWMQIRSKIDSSTIIGKNFCSFFPYIKEQKLKRKIATTLALNSQTFYSVEKDGQLIKIPLNNITDGHYEFMQQAVTIVPYNQDKQQVCIYIYDQTSLSTSLKKLDEYKQKLEKSIEVEIQNNLALQHIMDTNKQMLLISDGENITFANSSFLRFIKVNDIHDFKSQYNKLTDIFERNDNHLYDGLQNNDEKFLDFILSTEQKNRTIAIIDKSTNEQQIFFVDISLTDKYKGLYLWSFTNITDIALDNKELEYKVFHDPLTKVYNRLKLEEILLRDISIFQRYERSFCLTIIDIDHFKIFNDTHGHLVGDEVLISFAQAINDGIRATDLFARWGGEEFVALFLNTTIEDSQRAIEKIQASIATVVHKTAGKVTASFGLTQVKKGDEIKSIIQRADNALYKAKENGRDRYEVQL